ncbi:MAG: hypothetical protein ACFE88_16805 [Candidatus Hermodarchaeota archaeon]
MLLFSAVGLTNALFDIGIFFVHIILGLIFIYQGRKTNARLLFYFGLYVLGVGLSHTGHFVDFVTILITGNNMDDQLFPYLIWTTPPINNVIIIYVVAEILIPKKKWYFISFLLALSILFLLDLYIFNWTLEFFITEIEYPPNPGEELLDSFWASPFSIRWWYFTFSSCVFIGFGFLYKTMGIKGVIRKKYFYLSAYFIIFGVSQAIRVQLKSVLQEVIGENLIWVITFVSLIFAYLGLRAEPEHRKKKVKKKVKVKDSLFRIIERPEHISEEEVTYYREQKICLICKGKVTGFNIFLCPNCEALYHEDCARALTSMENACWVCIEPIDETKPTKPFKKVEEKKEVGKKNEKLIQN